MESSSPPDLNLSLLDYMTVEDFINLVKLKSANNDEGFLKVLDSLTYELKGLRALSGLGAALAQDNGKSNFIDKLMDTAYSVVNAEDILIFRIDADSQDFTITHSKRESLIGAKIMRRGSNQRNSDSRTSFKSQVAQLMDERTATATNCLIVSPIIVSGIIFGYCVARNTAPDTTGGRNVTTFDTTDESLMNFIAIVAGISLKQRSDDGGADAVVEVEVNDTTKRASRATSLDGLLQILLRDADKRLNADRLSFFAYNSESKMLECIVSPDIRGFQIPHNVGIAGSALMMNCVINVPETERDQRHFGDVDKRTGYRTRSLLCAPIVDESGKPLGVIQAVNKKSERAFNADDEEFIRDLCAQASSLLPIKARLSGTGLTGSNFVNSIIDLTNSNSINALGVGAAQVISKFTPCDCVGVFVSKKEEGGAAASLKLVTCADGLSATETFTSSSSSLTLSPTLLPTIIPSIILDCLKSGRPVEATRDTVDAKAWERLNAALFRGVEAQHILIYPFAPGVVSGTVHVGALDEGACVLVVARSRLHKAFDGLARDTLDVIVDAFSAAVRRIRAAGAAEASTLSTAAKFISMKAVADSSRDILLTLHPDGTIMTSPHTLGSLLGCSERSLAAGEHYSVALERGNCPQLWEDIEAVVTSRSHRRGSGVPFFSHTHPEGISVDYEISPISSSGLFNSGIGLPIDLIDTIRAKIEGDGQSSSAVLGIGVLIRPQEMFSVCAGILADARFYESPPEPSSANSATGVLEVARDLLRAVGTRYPSSVDEKVQERLEAIAVELASLAGATRGKEGSNGSSADAGAVGKALKEEAKKGEGVDGAKGGPAEFVTPKKKVFLTPLSLEPLHMQGEYFTLRTLSPRLKPLKRAPLHLSTSAPLLVNPSIALPEDYLDLNFSTLTITDPLVLCNTVGKLFDLLFDFDVLGIDPSVLAAYVFEVAVNYHDNPFHNFQHAAGVAHFSYQLISMTNAASTLTQMELFGIMLSAVVHDVDHPGNTNMFEINCRSELALRYNDQSVLENHHCSTAFQLMRQSRTDILGKLKSSTVNDLRKVMIACVMATDMSVHFQLVDETKKYAARVEECAAAAGPGAVSGSGDVFTEAADQLFFCKIILHAADLSNPVRPFHISKKWASRISEEFNSQVKHEEALGLPVLGFMITPDEKTLCKNEIGFASFVVAPMWRHLEKIFPTIAPLVRQLDSNLCDWKAAMEEATKLEEAAKLAPK